jgi:hypothetical protein
LHEVEVQVARLFESVLPVVWASPHASMQGVSLQTVVHCEYWSQSLPTPHLSFSVLHFVCAQPVQSSGPVVVPVSAVVPESTSVVGQLEAGVPQGLWQPGLHAPT